MALAVQIALGIILAIFGLIVIYFLVIGFLVGIRKFLDFLSSLDVADLVVGSVLIAAMVFVAWAIITDA